MKKKIGLLLAAVMVLNTVSSMAFGFTNPLKSYNLYEDTHPTNNNSMIVQLKEEWKNSTQIL